MDKEDKGTMAVVIFAMFVTTLVIAWSEIAEWKRGDVEHAHTLVMQYDCRIAEISVDYPQQVKEKCRKLLMPKVKEFK